MLNRVVKGVGRLPLVDAYARRAEARRRTATPLPSDPPEVAELLDSAEYAQQADDLAQRLDRPADEVRHQAAAHLRELAATHSEKVMEPWHRLGRWMLRGYDVLMDEESLAKLRALDREHSLVFLISHRSYLDEWAVPPALVDFGVEAPFGFAGANLDFFPLGTIARRTGIVHIRRTTADAPVYKFALRAFMRQLIANRANLIWSIEGGRSRTGKLRPPRFGLLRYVTDAVREPGGNEVLLVPVSILYDQLPTHEVDLMTSEARGQGKRAEDVRWFFDYLRGLRHRLGRIYVDFGEPLALRTRLAELDRSGPAETHVVERIALEVSHRINVATPVTPTAAVCIAMLAADRSLTLDEILATVRPMAGYLRARGWPIAGAANLNDRATIRRSLQDLVASGVLTSFQGGTTVWGVGPRQHLIAAVYRNSAIHVLVQRAILELALLRVARHEAAGALDEALRLRDLLKFDFFFPGRDEFAREMQSELRLLGASAGLSFGELTADQAQALIDGEPRFIAHLTLRPFFDAYAVVADQLAELGDTDQVDEERFLARCLVIGQQWALQRRIASEESASAEMFRTALRLADQLGLVASTEPELGARRGAFAQELADIRRCIEDIAHRPDWAS